MIRRNSVWQQAVTVGFFAAIALFFSRPLFVVSDFWWHIASGRWIVEHRALPAVDPFSLLPAAGAGSRETLILKGYWLAQVLFFQIHDWLGMPGLVAFKSLLLTAIVYCAWRVLVAMGVSSWRGLLLVTPLVVYLRSFDELRPHLFSFLGVVLVILLMERCLGTFRAAGRPDRRIPVVLAVTMLLWANMHPGVIVGNGVLLVYLAAGLAGVVFEKKTLRDSRLAAYCLTCIPAMLASLITPCGLLVYRSLATDTGIGGKFAETITEYQPVWSYFAARGESYLFYGMLLLFLVAGIAGIVARKRLRLEDICLFLLFCVAGFSSFRYSAFFVISAIFLLGRTVGGRAFIAGDRPALAGWTLVGLAALLMLVDVSRTSALRRGAVALGPVAKAVAFVRDQALPGHLFAPYEWGGYLQWTLYPDYRTFVDPRTLNYDLYAEYREVTQGRKGRAFQKYGFNTVLFYRYPPAKRQIPGLIFSLLGDGEWALLYKDENALVFSKTPGRSAYPVIDKNEYMMLLEKELVLDSRAEPGNPSPLVDLGQLHYVRKNFGEARRCFSKALEVDPLNEFAASWLKHLSVSGQ